jgi:hypothetical protein
VKRSKGGRPKLRHPIAPALARKMIRQHALTRSYLNIIFAKSLFGWRICAEELMRRYKQACERAGCRYHREDAISEAARLLGMNYEQVAGWISRSRKKRGE